MNILLLELLLLSTLFVEKLMPPLEDDPLLLHYHHLLIQYHPRLYLYLIKSQRSAIAANIATLTTKNYLNIQTKLNEKAYKYKKEEVRIFDSNLTYLLCLVLVATNSNIDPLWSDLEKSAKYQKFEELKCAIYTVVIVLGMWDNIIITPIIMVNILEM